MSKLREWEKRIRVPPRCDHTPLARVQSPAPPEFLAIWPSLPVYPHLLRPSAPSSPFWSVLRCSWILSARWLRSMGGVLLLGACAADPPGAVPSQPPSAKVSSERD